MHKKLSSISFVIPCLNEEKTLAEVLKTIKKTNSNHFSNRKVEIIVTDNKSKDSTIKIAKSHDVRVVTCKKKGYGANLNNGFQSAKNDIIIFADADNSYDFSEAPKLVKKLEEGYDLVLGSRYKGNIQKGAMPLLHKYFGTPILTSLINWLFNKKKHKISDCNSGFRCFYRKKYPLLNLHSSGMEFASEMIVSALKNNFSLAEVPITLKPDGRERAPSLQTWRDGTRHLLQILAASPHLFFWLGIIMIFPSFMILIFCAFNDIIFIKNVGIFGIHSALVSTIIYIVGLQVWTVGIFIADPDSYKIYYKLAKMVENKLFFFLFLLFIYTISSIFWVFYQWSLFHYQVLAIEKKLILIIAIFLLFFQLAFSLVVAKLIEKR